MTRHFKQFIHKTKSCLHSRLTLPIQPCTEHIRRVIPCASDKVSLVSESSALFHVTTASAAGYFSPCRKHLPLDAYVREFVNDYYDFITDAPSFAASDRQMILDSLSDPVRMDRFTKMSSPTVPDSALSRFLNGSDPSLIGLCFDAHDKAMRDRVRRFVAKYAWCQLHMWNLHHALPDGHWQTRAFCISLATEALARLLELEELFPHAEYAWLRIEGQEPIFGLFMDTASGCGIIDVSLERRAAAMTPHLQRAFSRLSILDAITHEMDHSPNNYNVVFDDSGMAVGLSVFDNNGIGTFALQTSASFKTYKNCSHFLRPDGTVNRPHLDAALCRKLSKITFLQFFKCLRPFLRFPQILAAWLRLKNVKAAIEKTDAKAPGFLLDEDQWNEETLQAELSGTYGKTYLMSYLQDCCVPLS